MTVAELVGQHARATPDGLAFASELERLTWAGYDAWSDRLAGRLVEEGFEPGDRVAIQLPDGPGLGVVPAGADAG